MSSTMSESELYFFDDSSSSDESDLEELLHDDDTEQMVLLLAVKEIEDRLKMVNRRRGSVLGRLCIPRNRALGHIKLMGDYFDEVPTYPPCISSVEGFECGEACLSKSLKLARPTAGTSLAVETLPG